MGLERAEANEGSVDKSDELLALPWTTNPPKVDEAEVPPSLKEKRNLLIVFFF